MNAKSIVYRTSILAACSVFALQIPAARAEIVSTDAVQARHQAETERAKVQTFLERADVRQRMQTLGVQGLQAGDRVAALSDQEVHALAGKIDSMPAGGNLGSNDLIIILLIAILVVVAV